MARDALTDRELLKTHSRTVLKMLENCPQLGEDELLSLYYRTKLMAHYALEELKDV